MNVRDVLMVIYAMGWLTVMVVVAIRVGLPPPELWAALGIGEGTLLAVFRGEEEYVRRRAGNGHDPGGGE